ncbi:trifunctional transcriptional regulator/proline dehydrogenase/L-glutamate gamma-semialdehyde dehydrogenase [Aquabacterium sp. J223]|uniref:trifunctional transcriptional regulator/proline dehydrogenase/L-glutamate gamma-semialdehyde dehydrogenase n=1 Tax=Aquabacterium sp. J223 TaxID=2898431 RepID=UPI0021ADE9DC|nr:trifunctional transcriptional regulator/proline dehydrogenase/L-glutamate gamma-semialdehyde dehydrogenase [Aquabacterium sp. J223]UUX97459.1 trifunctional transcriptional regulator/proline dehydrogenase/L-glutamate gamma-semialdehyde dehydrogenase [Aquabacterium sp. J223]
MHPSSPAQEPPADPFSAFAGRSEAPHDDTREAIDDAARLTEPEAVAALLDAARLPEAASREAQALALRLAAALRERPTGFGRAAWVQGLLQRYSLSSDEGVALMCLAEALLRIPDAATRDALIRDKLGAGRWEDHLQRSPSPFVNAAAWGLLFTGKLLGPREGGLAAVAGRLLARGGEPLVRAGVDMAVRLMGEQFVAGRTIHEALARARALEARGFRHSYDMLGEAAVTHADAERYGRAYAQAIAAIGASAHGRGVRDGPGISIKLSALHPRYRRAQRERVMDELYPRLLGLVLQARQQDIGLNLDAEEADRLLLSLDLLQRLCAEPALAGWQGLGVVVQAYQLRAPFVVDHLVALARRSGRRLMVRLVKGAYWDSEVKRAQVDGLDGYPVYTRKAHTDVAYLACARRLLAAPDAVYPQFATHNAQTLAAVHQMADPAAWTPGQYEFQCLHGMGEPLYERVVPPVSRGGLGRPCRIYAPVGPHETLLAYLVRRLLENGANTSFVHQVADHGRPLAALVRDPVAEVVARARDEGGEAGRPHPSIPLPARLYGPARRNARGLDLASDAVLRTLQAELQEAASTPSSAGPLLADNAPTADTAPRPVHNPADTRDVVGQVQDATPADVDAAVRAAQQAWPAWRALPPTERAARLETAADLFEAERPRLMALLVREAGKTVPNALAEVREAVDFLRHDAAELRAHFDNHSHRPLGALACISPWNFPLAIFTGQVAAALAAGNTVLAKPAEQTPLVAAEAVRLLHCAGVPQGALQLLPGDGDGVGRALVAHEGVRGVLFTGSTAVAKGIARQLADRLDDEGRPLPLIAETGGQNAMIVDASALPEQVVADALASAFDSAGQRCSALRVLCLQADIAQPVLDLLKGAMAELQVGPPDRLSCDVGPVIDTEALDRLQRHVEAMRSRGRPVHQPAPRGADDARAHGTFMPPTLIELQRLDELTEEVFGPVLHVLRWRRGELPALLASLHATGHGLTLGLHTRIDETVRQVVDNARVGNVYVNRTMVGAVVGVQPFGGEGLSGTGPKAGGPLYMTRLLAARPALGLARALRGDRPAPPAPPPLLALRGWATAQGRAALADACERFAAESCAGLKRVLPGPTGEHNELRLLPRRAVLCHAEADADRLLQLAAVLAVGSTALWPSSARPLRDRLPAPVRTQIRLHGAPDMLGANVDAAMHHGERAELLALQRQLAERPGPIAGLQGLRSGDGAIALERLLVERAVSINTAAAGGNASLTAVG